jgi:hypothetical protein
MSDLQKCRLLFDPILATHGNGGQRGAGLECRGLDVPDAVGDGHGGQGFVSLERTIIDENRSTKGIIGILYISMT